MKPKKLVIKPMSINSAFQGRRFKTKEYNNYEEELLWMLKIEGLEKVEGFVSVAYNFYLIHYLKTDVGNLEKPLSDIIVKAGLIDDDRFIKKITMEKFKSDKNYIEIQIEKYD